MLGNKNLEISDNGSVIIDDDTYPGSEELYNMIFLKEVDLSKIDLDKKRIYWNIIRKTSLHKQKYNPTANINGTRAPKYVNIIKPILETFRETTGSGLKFVVTDKKKYWRWWDDPNELCARLEILVGEKIAGNNIHDAEISSILSELRQRKYIKRIPKKRW